MQLRGFIFGGDHEADSSHELIISQQAIVLQHIERIAKVGHFFSSVKTHSYTPQLQKIHFKTIVVLVNFVQDCRGAISQFQSAPLEHTKWPTVRRYRPAGDRAGSPAGKVPVRPGSDISGCSYRNKLVRARSTISSPRPFRIALIM